MVESGDVTVGDSDNVAVVKRREIDALLADPQGATEKENCSKPSSRMARRMWKLRMKRGKSPRRSGWIKLPALDLP